MKQIQSKIVTQGDLQWIESWYEDEAGTQHVVGFDLVPVPLPDEMRTFSAPEELMTAERYGKKMTPHHKEIKQRRAARYSWMREMVKQGKMSPHCLPPDHKNAEPYVGPAPNATEEVAPVT